MRLQPTSGLKVHNLTLLQGDLALIMLSVLVSFALRLGVGPMLVAFLSAAWLMLVLAFLIKPAVYHAFGLYQPAWSTPTRREMLAFVLAPATAATLVALSLWLAHRLGALGSFPRSVILIDWVLSVVCVGGLRFTLWLLGARRAKSAYLTTPREPSGCGACRSLRWLELGWHVGVFLLMMMVFIKIWPDWIGLFVTDGDMALVLQAVLLGTCAVFGVRHANPRQIAAALGRSAGLWGLVAWAGVSALWSWDGSLTLSWALIAFLTAAYSLIMLERHAFRYVLSVAGIALAVALLGSVISVRVFDIGVMTGMHEGAWRGVLFHKNALGHFSAIGLAVFATLANLSSDWRRWVWIGLLGCALITLVASRSATAMVGTATMSVVVLGLVLMRKVPGRFHPVILIIGLSSIVTVMLTSLDLLKRAGTLMGKSVDLTGRVPLWEVLWPIVLEQPLLGRGLGGFWHSRDVAGRVWSTIGWRAMNAHNGYLDLWLELGLVGLALGLILTGGLVVRSIRGSLADPAPQAWLFCAAMSVVVIVTNLVESVFLSITTLRMFFWFIFCYAYLLTALRLAPPAPPDVPERRSLPRPTESCTGSVR